MPRAGKYTPWTLKTAVLLASTMTAAERGAIPEPDWRGEGKKGKGGKEVRHTVEGAEGRPHYEEAVLIQLRGTVNNPACAKCADGQGPFLSCKSVSTAHFGACGCCVWESKAIDCTLQAVQDIRASRNAARKLVQDNKATTRELRGNVSSKNTRKTMVEGDAGPKGAAGRKKNAGRAKKPTGTRRNTRQSAADEE